MDPAQREERFLQQARLGSRVWNRRAKLVWAYIAFFGLVFAGGAVRLFAVRDEGDVAGAVVPIVLSLALIAWQLSLQTHYELLEGAALHLERSPPQ